MARRAGSGISRHNSVATNPGATAFTRSGASSTASARVSASTAPQTLAPVGLGQRQQLQAVAGGVDQMVEPAAGAEVALDGRLAGQIDGATLRRAAEKFQRLFDARQLARYHRHVRAGP